MTPDLECLHWCKSEQSWYIDLITWVTTYCSWREASSTSLAEKSCGKAKTFCSLNSWGVFVNRCMRHEVFYWGARAAKCYQHAVSKSLGITIIFWSIRNERLILSFAPAIIVFQASFLVSAFELLKDCSAYPELTEGSFQKFHSCKV